ANPGGGTGDDDEIEIDSVRESPLVGFEPRRDRGWAFRPLEDLLNGTRIVSIRGWR
ncbi:MAG: hypothetical protein ACI8VE_002521, partial [Natrialbaceae archaeon]